MKGVKGFQSGRIVPQETRDKISIANSDNFISICDYCGNQYKTKKSHHKRQKRHFCSRKCYSLYRTEIMPKEEQNSFGAGHSIEERKLRNKARYIFNHYRRDNKITRQPCEICGELGEAHHDNYAEPLNVRWLCFKHHREWHKIHDHPELLTEK